jgi:hypothetical protein
MGKRSSEVESWVAWVGRASGLGRSVEVGRNGPVNGLLNPWALWAYSLMACNVRPYVGHNKYLCYYYFILLRTFGPLPNVRKGLALMI